MDTATVVHRETAPPAAPDPARPVRRHRTWRRTLRLLLAGALAAVLASMVVVVVHRWRALHAEPPVDPGRSAWALLDLATGELRTSAEAAETYTAESMIKVWIAADDLRRLAERRIRPHPDEIAALSAMIRDSDDHAAEVIYQRNGADAVVQRLISICGLTETTVRPGWWSLTRMSARDAARMGGCLADGRAAGPRWTKWVLEQMRRVRGEGYFGIVSALPAAQRDGLAIKNGWTLHVNEGRWAVNCLAVSDDWVLAVQTRYPAALGGLDHGGRTCAEVASRVLAARASGRPGTEAGADALGRIGGAR
ncbi:serine hydrolase [Plantactinospora sp. CA-290183]|uniref:serine hydrolase n=1 Tax=Plantactinospora sp. CA-290183 TaxID=3240006 RepID=UPI003D8D794E